MQTYYSYRACDVAGNCTDTETRTIKLDRSNPEVTIFKFQPRTTSDNLYGLFAGWQTSDSLSGVSSLTTSYPFYKLRDPDEEIGSSFGAGTATSYNTNFTSTNYLNLGSGYSDTYRIAKFDFYDKAGNLTTKKIYIFPWEEFYYGNTTCDGDFDAQTDDDKYYDDPTSEEDDCIITKSGKSARVVGRIIEYLEGNKLTIRWEVRFGGATWHSTSGYTDKIELRNSAGTVVLSYQITPNNLIDCKGNNCTSDKIGNGGVYGGTITYTATASDRYDIYFTSNTYSTKRLGYMNINVS